MVSYAESNWLWAAKLNPKSELAPDGTRNKQGLGALGRMAKVFGCSCTHLVSEHASWGCSGNIHSCKCKGELKYLDEAPKQNGYGPRFGPERPQEGEKILVGCRCDCPIDMHDEHGCQQDIYVGCNCPGKVIIPVYLKKPRIDLGKPEFELTNCTCNHPVREHDETGCTYIEGIVGECVCRGKLLPVTPRSQAGFVPHSQVSGVRLQHPIKGGVFGTASTDLKDCTCKHMVFEHGDAGCTHVAKIGELDELCPCTGYLVEYGSGDCCTCKTPNEVFSCHCNCHELVEWDKFCTCDHLPQQHSVNGCNLCDCRGVVKAKVGGPTLKFARASSRCNLDNCCNNPLTMNNPNKCMCACHRVEKGFSGVDQDHDQAALAELGKKKLRKGKPAPVM